MLIRFPDRIHSEHFEEALRDKKWRPVRWSGVVAMILLLPIVFFLTSPPPSMLTPLVSKALVQFNRATVDLDEVVFDAKNGHFVIRGLQLADPNALSENLLRLDIASVSVDMSDLLRKTYTLEEIEVSGFAIGIPRGIPSRFITCNHRVYKPGLIYGKSSTI